MMTSLPLEYTLPKRKYPAQWRVSLLLRLAALLLLVSIALPYWRLTLKAPQYPGGLHVQVFANQMTGDTREIDGLNHYIGMSQLDEAAQVERRISTLAILAFALLLVGASVLDRTWTFLLTVPAAVFPVVFLADLWFWMRHHGQNLDPRAPLSSSISPFTPTVLGTGVIGQFSTTAWVSYGFYLLLLADALILAAFVLRRRKAQG